jgi:amino acid transporter
MCAGITSASTASRFFAANFFIAFQFSWVAIVFTTAIAFAVILYVTLFAGEDSIAALGGTTSLLLLAVFTMVNIAVLVRRRDDREPRQHYRTPTALPVLGRMASLYLVTPLSGRPASDRRRRADRRRVTLAVELPTYRRQPVLRFVEKCRDVRHPRT